MGLGGDTDRPIHYCPFTKIYVGTLDMSVGNFFCGENIVVFRNLTRRSVKTTLYSLFNFPSIFIEATRLLLGFAAFFTMSGTELEFV